jgi:hypothetical protein
MGEKESREEIKNGILCSHTHHSLFTHHHLKEQKTMVPSATSAVVN